MFKKMIRGLIKAVQRTLLSVSLFLVYYVVFGVTVVVAFLFNSLTLFCALREVLSAEIPSKQQAGFKTTMPKHPNSQQSTKLTNYQLLQQATTTINQAGK